MKTVLFVDDEPTVLRSLARLFRTTGYEVLTAASAFEALEILAEQPVSVVVSDHRMPGMVGTELLALVAARYPTCGRILLTGDMGALENEAAALAVAHVMLRKPSSPQELRETIERVMPPDVEDVRLA
ncbi:MAG TPA: response regulator [Kofleriaceae bacterium]|jgi:CheY-like chemotaxis protein